MTEKISNDRYNEAKTNAQENEPKAKTYKLGDIDFSAKSLKDEIITIKGIGEVPVTSGFVSDLARILNVNKKLAKDLSNNDEFYHSILAALKANKANSNLDVTLVAAPNGRCIMGIYTKYSRISNVQLFNAAERIVDENPGLVISNVWGDDTGNPVITMQTDNIIEFPEINADESFKFGIALANEGHRTQLGDYNYRLICSNGMMSNNPELGFPTGGGLGGLSPEDMLDFFNQVNDYARRGFVPENFANQMKNAHTTPCSLNELEQAYNLVRRKIDESDPTMKAVHEKTIKAKWFWGLNDAYHRIEKAKIKYEDLSYTEKSIIKTPQPVWDMINSLTNLGSNKHMEPLKNQVELVSSAGKKLFQKEFDLQNVRLLEL